MYSIRTTLVVPRQCPLSTFAVTIFLGFFIGLNPSAFAGEKPRKNLTPPNRITSEELEAYWKVKAILDKKSRASLPRFQNSAPDNVKPSYPVTEVIAYEKAEQVAAGVRTLEELKKASGYQGPKTFPWLSMRRSYTDVLTGEDPSLQVAGKEGFDDLEGALFSYTRDFKSNVDTWATEMAMLAPFSYATGNVLHGNQGLTLARYGFVPSYSLHRVSTSGDPESEIDLQTLRFGVFAKWESGCHLLERLTLRGFATYAYDNVKDMSVRAGEFDLEPQSNLDMIHENLRVGYRTILISKDDPEHINDTAILAYQLRAILHGQYGEVRSEGANFKGSESTFFRIGPKLSLDLKPLFVDRLSARVTYGYQPALKGPKANETLFTADLSWDLLKDEAERRRLTLTVSYVDGGLELTQAQVRTLQVSLGAAF
jgi:hypothetical protein